MEGQVVNGKYVRPDCDCKGKTGVRPKICPHHNHAVDPKGGANEWHPKKNEGIRPEQVSRATGSVYWYLCPNEWCEMAYEQTPHARSSSGARCPYCAGMKVCEWNCLLTNYPELCEEYDQDNVLTPDKVHPGTPDKVNWFHVANDGKIHKWSAQVRKRTQRYQGCQRCAVGGAQMFGGHEFFVQEARKVHGDKYSYNDEYKGTKTPINIYCPIVGFDGKVHGDFPQTPDSHKAGRGCHKCASGGEQQIGGHAYFLHKAREVHGDKYVYNEEYQGNNIPINIYCPVVDRGVVHGNFPQTPHSHKAGRGCSKCNVNGIDQRLGGHAYFVQEARKVHGDKYLYNEEYKADKIAIHIYCPAKSSDGNIHGNFMQTPHDHKAGAGCKKCADERTESKLITDIRGTLTALNLGYVLEQTFEGLKYIKKLRIDIVASLITDALCIEGDGKQHFEISSWGDEETLKLSQQRDVVKDYFCVKNKFNLIRIPYTKSPTQIKAIIEEAIADIKAGHQIYVTYRNYYDSLEPHLQELAHFKDVKVTIMAV